MCLSVYIIISSKVYLKNSKFWCGIVSKFFKLTTYANTPPFFINVVASNAQKNSFIYSDKTNNQSATSCKNPYLPLSFSFVK